MTGSSDLRLRETVTRLVPEWKYMSGLSRTPSETSPGMSMPDSFRVQGPNGLEPRARYPTPMVTVLPFSQPPSNSRLVARRRHRSL